MEPIASKRTELIQGLSEVKTGSTIFWYDDSPTTNYNWVEFKKTKENFQVIATHSPTPLLSVGTIVSERWLHHNLGIKCVTFNFIWDFANENPL